MYTHISMTKLNSNQTKPNYTKKMSKPNQTKTKIIQKIASSGILLHLGKSRAHQSNQTKPKKKQKSSKSKKSSTFSFFSVPIHSLQFILLLVRAHFIFISIFICVFRYCCCCWFYRLATTNDLSNKIVKILLPKRMQKGMKLDKWFDCTLESVFCFQLIAFRIWQNNCPPKKTIEIRAFVKSKEMKRKIESFG